jgi:hypothetical protein
MSRTAAEIRGGRDIRVELVRDKVPGQVVVWILAPAERRVSWTAILSPDVAVEFAVANGKALNIPVLDYMTVLYDPPDRAAELKAAGDKLTEAANELRFSAGLSFTATGKGVKIRLAEAMQKYDAALAAWKASRP